MKKTVYIESPWVDPARNLALEEYIFTSLPRNRDYLLLWQNDNTIVIGRHQNTLSEIDLGFVQRRSIRVVRRLSGGGAVYHDLGNLNFSIITDAAPGGQVDLRRFCQPIAHALQGLGLQAQVDGRNDILAEGCKISGNAQYVREGRVMHHGTLLFDSDLTVLGQALQPDPEKIKSKGVASVRSRVANIRTLLSEDITLDAFKSHIAGHLLQGLEHSSCTLTQQDVAAIDALAARRYSTWQWNYGASPPCSLSRRQRFDGCGTLQAHIQLEHGCISVLEFTGDFFATQEPQDLARQLIGLPLTAAALTEKLQAIPVEQYITGLKSQQLVQLLTE